MNRGTVFGLLVAVQALVLAGIAGMHFWQRATAETWLVAGAPVDPRDPLRGDYMILRFSIHTPPPGEWTELRPGREVWVRMRPDEGRFLDVVEVLEQRAEKRAGELMVRARLSSGGRLVYGVENYFVPEGMGTPRFETLAGEVYATPDGSLRLRRLLLDGDPYP